MDIHPQAIVDASARLGDGVRVGPFTCIGPDVEIGAGSEIGPNVLIEGNTVLGKKCRVFHGASIGGEPQVAGFENLPSGVHIGDECVIREYATIHRSMYENQFTRMGLGCMLMAYGHVAHDCQIGDHVVIVNGTGLSGHVVVGDHAFVSGMVGTHQEIRIGAHSMVGGFTVLRKDVIPFGLVEGVPPRLVGINSIGLRRRKIAPKIRSALKEAVRLLKDPGLNTSQAVERITEGVEALEAIKSLTEFIQTSSRGIIK
ncbi:MAG: acyl-ACP--UDP-N-acetylglucosamine O-acyltransferase [Nitrospinaceae bacterium]